MEIQILMKGEGPLQPVTSHIEYALKSNFGALFFFLPLTLIFFNVKQFSKFAIVTG